MSAGAIMAHPFGGAMRLGRVAAFVRLTRPFFLLGGVLAYGFGLAYARWEGFAIDGSRALVGQVMVTLAQLVAQYANEYYDFEVDRLGENRTWFTGGSGVLPGGLIARRVALVAALLCAAGSLAVTFVASAWVPIAGIIGVAGLLGSWFYSAPPLSLKGSGWGELEASMIVAVLTPVLGYVLQAGRVAPSLFLACLPLLALHTAMLLTFELPDRKGDLAAGKRTVAVRMGVRSAVTLHHLLVGAAILILAIPGLGSLSRFTWLVVPLAIWQVVRLESTARRGRAHWPSLVFGAIALFALATGLLSAGALAAAVNV